MVDKVVVLDVKMLSQLYAGGGSKAWIAFFFISFCPAVALGQISNDTPIHRYQIACHTKLLNPTFLTSFDRSNVFEGQLIGVDYKDGRDLSFTPYELKDLSDGLQIMRGFVSDLRARGAKIESEYGFVTQDIYTLSNQWECRLLDNKSTK